MNKFNEKRYAAIKSAFEKAQVPRPDPSTPIEIDPEALMTFVVWGDPQLFSASVQRCVKIAAACEDLKNIDGKLDALIIAGDVVEMGMECEYKFTSELLNGCSEHFRRFYAVPGNHDVRKRNFNRQFGVFKNFVESVNGGYFGGKTRYFYSVDYDCCKFIFMGTDMTTFEGAYYSPAQFRFIDEQIAAAQNRGVPAFVINHQTLAKTNGLPVTWGGNGSWRGSVGWQNEKLKRIFEKYDNVIFITGHLHYGTSKYTFEDCGCFKALSVPTVGVVNHGPFNTDSQGYVVTVYKDKIVFRSRLFGEGRYVDSSQPGGEIIIDNYSKEGK